MERTILSVLILIFAVLFYTFDRVDAVSNVGKTGLGNSVASPTFYWGCATAAFQIEGAWDRDGKQVTEPDFNYHFPHNSDNGSNGDVADDDYDLFPEDVDLLVNLNVSAYRFSIAWGRIIDSNGEPNMEGIDHYNDLIDLLVSYHITPFVTMFHGDLPFAFSSYFNPHHGFLSLEYFQPKFLAYAETLFMYFGDRVKHWITFNEPKQICIPYETISPLHGDYNTTTAQFDCAKTVIITQMEVIKLYRTLYEPVLGEALIGMTLDGDFATPWRAGNNDDAAACERALAYGIAWFGDPMWFGDWPQEMRNRMPAGVLPPFTPEEKADLLAYKPDFFAHNHYTTHYYSNNPNDTTGQGADSHDDDPNGVPIGPLCYSTWLRVVPWGFNSMLKWISNRYNNPLIFITENGCDVPGENVTPLPAVLNDTMRVNYYKEYIGNMTAAIESGVTMGGYFTWSLLDNYEWGTYEARFGIHYVDYNTQKRYPKNSAVWYGQHVTKWRTEHEEGFIGVRERFEKEKRKMKKSTTPRGKKQKGINVKT